LAQATGILSFKVIGKPKDDELYYFAAIDNARFKRPVFPGDQLVLDVELLREVKGIAKFTGVASVDGKVVCTAELLCAKRKA
jgi:3-hydroxyacyl-[acyl-carrier-protein] dehydratase